MTRIRILIAAALVLAQPAGAEPPAAEPPAVSVAPRLTLVDPESRALWDEAVGYERDGRFDEAIARMQALQRAVPGSSTVHWRTARLHWRSADLLARDDKQGRVAAFDSALEASGLGLDANPECAECMLWRVAAMGRLATTQGITTATSQAEEMASLIDRGIALTPTHSDGPSNTSLGNLYYAGAVFYRIVPDWFWIEWVIGVRGDRERSVAYGRKAVAMSETRVDYRVELGAGLICLGESEDDPARVAEGLRVLDEAAALSTWRHTDTIDLEHAQLIADEPERACGYSRDGWIELDEESTRESGL